MRSHRSLCRWPFRTGAVTPLTVLCLSLLLGMAALTIDGGMLMEDRRHAQATADAAALAAADDLFAHYVSNQGIDSNGTARASALTIAAANGFNNDGTQSIVTINTSPRNYQGGPNVGKPLPAGYVEVMVQYNASRLFSGIFGSGTIPVPARAVARGQWLPHNDAVLALSPNAAPAVTINGNARLTIPNGGGMQINSNSLLALVPGKEGALTASSLTLNPIFERIGRILAFLLKLSVNYSSPMPDPLRYLPPPDPSKLSARTIGGQDLYPGVYDDGILVSGKATYILHANSDGTPGIYYLQGGGLTISGQATVKMAADAEAGVMIYNAGDTIQVVGQGSLNLSPPSSGPYRGIGLFQKRGTPLIPAPPIIISGQGNLAVAGAVYAANANVKIAGNGRAIGSQFIVDTVAVVGDASLTVNRGSQPVAHTRLLGLVE